MQETRAALEAWRAAERRLEDATQGAARDPRSADALAAVVAAAQAVRVAHHAYRLEVERAAHEYRLTQAQVAREVEQHA